MVQDATTYTITATNGSGTAQRTFTLEIADNSPMTLTIDTSLGANTIGLPLMGTVNVTVNWGDGTTSSTTNHGRLEHTYAEDVSGSTIYVISISGSLTQFNNVCQNGVTFGFKGAELVTEINSFGNIGLTTIAGMFSPVSGSLWPINLVKVPSSIPGTITNICQLFLYASKFNDPAISSWDTSSVTSTSRLFYDASLFNQPLDSWNVSNVTNMSQMFWNATSFNQDLNSWNTAKVTDMSNMLRNAPMFNGNIASWNTSKVTSMSGMFRDAKLFNQNLNSWNTSRVTNMYSVFCGATIFNGDISSWDTSNVTDMSQMFFGTPFNRDISRWNTRNLNIAYSMFYGAAAFNQNISGWDTSKLANMYQMFYNASAFNQNLSTWNVSALNATAISGTSGATNMLTGTGMSTANYDATLIGWASRPVLVAPFSATTVGYSSAGATARSALISSGWTITDFGLATVPGTPTAAPVGIVGSQQVTLTWAAPTSKGGDVITGYNVKWSSTATGTYVDATGCTGLGNVLTCVATGLTTGAPYYFKVAAINGQGTGTYSSASLIRTPT